MIPPPRRLLSIRLLHPVLAIVAIFWGCLSGYAQDAPPSHEIGSRVAVDVTEQAEPPQSVIATDRRYRGDASDLFVQTSPDSYLDPRGILRPDRLKVLVTPDEQSSRKARHELRAC